MNGAIIIGWINKGKPADCGETMKNQLMIHRLEELGVKCRCVELEKASLGVFTVDLEFGNT